MFKAQHCYIRDNDDGTSTTSVEISHPGDATEKAGYPFGSRSFGETKKKINDVLNGKFYRLPFGIRVIKI